MKTKRIGFPLAPFAVYLGAGLVGLVAGLVALILESFGLSQIAVGVKFFALLCWLVMMLTFIFVLGAKALVWVGILGEDSGQSK
jgi:cytochrome c biogenesis factor